MAEANNKQDQSKKLNAVIWTCAAALILLVILTTAVVILRVGNYLPEEWNVVFLVPKEPSFVIEDAADGWQEDNHIEVFKAEYKNESGEVVIESANGDSVFAPGSLVDYTFNLKNNGNMAIDYNVELDFDFLKNNETFDFDNCPMLVRVYKADHEDYIVGGDDTWVPVSELGVYSDKGTLGVNSYNQYTLEIKWLFENGNDENDTLLGNLVVNDSIVFALDINTHAEQNPDPDAKGGIIEIDNGTEVKKIGGDINLIPFIILILVLALAAGGLITGIIIKNKNQNKNTPDGK